MSETVFTYAAPGAEVRRRGVRRGRPRPGGVRRPAGAAGDRPGRRGDRSPGADRRADAGPRASTSTTYDGVRVEPTDESMARRRSRSPASAGPFDAIVAVGGGSSIDTAKAVNLLLTNPGELMDYINAPVGKAPRAGSTPLLPLVAVPTTTGTGSESTTICVLDVLSLQVKTGISHPRAAADRWRSSTRRSPLTQPAMVTAAAGMDILCHALESYTARWYADFDAKRPEQRVPYCGANPIADMWSERALSLLAGAFRTAVRDGSDAGPASRWRWRRRSPGSASATPACTSRTPTPTRSPAGCATTGPTGYPEDEPIVPHGMAVSLTAPEAFRFTFEAAPERHLRAARLLDPDAPATGRTCCPACSPR